MSLPTIESSFVMHTTKGIQGFDNPEYPAVRLALEVLNATESYLWVSHISPLVDSRSHQISSAISVVPALPMGLTSLWTLRLVC